VQELLKKFGKIYNKLIEDNMKYFYFAGDIF